MPVTRTDKFHTTLKKLVIAFSILCLLGLTTFAFVKRSKRPDEVKFYYDSEILPSGAPSFTRGYSTGALV